MGFCPILIFLPFPLSLLILPLLLLQDCRENALQRLPPAEQNVICLEAHFFLGCLQPGKGRHRELDQGGILHDRADGNPAYEHLPQREGRGTVPHDQRAVANRDEQNSRGCDSGHMGDPSKQGLGERARHRRLRVVVEEDVEGLSRAVT